MSDGGILLFSWKKISRSEMESVMESEMVFGGFSFSEDRVFHQSQT